MKIPARAMRCKTMPSIKERLADENSRARLEGPSFPRI